MKLIGLTGGIGSGKTTVAKIFETMDVPVYNSDLRARWIMENNPEIIQKIKDHFGPLTYNAEQKLNRPYLANKIFNNSTEISWINSIVHPAVGLDLKNWCKKQHTPFAIKESALLIETLNQQAVDKIIVVLSAEHLRIERIQKRDQSSKDEINKKLEAQISDEKRIPFADYIIYNYDDNSLIRQTLKIYKNLKELFN